MITEKKGFKFDYDVVDNCFEELINVEIGKIFVSEESAEKIEKLLHLKDKARDIEGLRAIRNAVVDRISTLEKKMANLDEHGERIPGKEINYDEMMKYSNKISGITAVIDKYMFCL